MRLTVPAVLLLVATLGGCAALTPPERPTYEGQDTVTLVDPSMLHGTWNVTVLNPIEGQEQQTTLVTFVPDGTYIGAFDVPAQNGVTSDMAFEVTGDWSVGGETVTLSNVEVTSTDDDNAIGSLITSLMNRQSNRLEGTANVYEVSDTHLVLVDEDGQALRYDRAA